MGFKFQFKLLTKYLEFARTELKIVEAEKRTIEEFLWRLDNGLCDFDEWWFIVNCL